MRMWFLQGAMRPRRPRDRGVLLCGLAFADFDLISALSFKW
jgi:hypothetical protein